MSENFDYYRVEFKLVREMLGTLSEASIMHEHVTKVAMKAIKKANKEGAKITKAMEKYYGADISDEKQIAEIKGTINTFSELTGTIIEDLPDSMDELLAVAAELEKKYQEIVKRGNMQKATVFMRIAKPGYKYGTWPIISTHMVLGNLKAIASTITNVSTEDKDNKLFKSKVAVREALALDVKAIEFFMEPSNDIRRWGDGSPDMFDMPKEAQAASEPNSDRMLLERPIRFERMGKDETAIAISERLPVDTTFGCTLRVRKNSVLTQSALENLFDYGKNLGFGQWRGSGNMGAYKYKLEKLKDFNETDADGFK